MAHHFAVVHWFTRHPGSPRPAGLQEMSYYPPGAHWTAVAVQGLIGSPFAAMNLVGIASVAGVWLGIGGVLASLPLRRAAPALVVTGLVLAASARPGPLDLQLHGYEVVGNYFYSQVVGQAVFWLLALLTVRSLVGRRSWLRSVVPLSVGALLLTEVHALPALQAVVLLGTVALRETALRWSTVSPRSWRSALPLAWPAVVGLGVLVSPGFSAMRRLSVNDGALEIPHLGGLTSYAVLSVLVVVLSLGALLVARGSGDARSSAVCFVLGSVGLAMALPCLAQAAALASGEGSPYAIKKYGFGLLTVLVVELVALASVLVPLGDEPLSGAAARLAVPVLASALALLALEGLQDHPASYQVAAVASLDERLDRVHAQLAASGRQGHDYAVRLPGSDPVLDYMLSIASLEAPRDAAATAVLTGRPLPSDGSVRDIVSSGGTASDAGCSTRSEGLTITSGTCYATPPPCPLRRDLGAAGAAGDRGLEGFSAAEQTGRWTDGPRARVTCELPQALRGHALRVVLEASAFLPPGVTRQRVRLAVGPAAQEAVLAQGVPDRPVVLDVPRAPSDLVLELSLPDAVSPAAAGVSVDARQLGLFVRAVSVEAR